MVGSDRLQLVVDEQALLDDLNPYAPDGWWTAVDALQGRCVVVITRHGDVDLGHHHASMPSSTPTLVRTRLLLDALLVYSG